MAALRSRLGRGACAPHRGPSPIYGSVCRCVAPAVVVVAMAVAAVHRRVSMRRRLENAGPNRLSDVAELCDVSDRNAFTDDREWRGDVRRVFVRNVPHRRHHSSRPPARSEYRLYKKTTDSWACAFSFVTWHLRRGMSARSVRFVRSLLFVHCYSVFRPSAVEKRAKKISRPSSSPTGPARRLCVCAQVRECTCASMCSVWSPCACASVRRRRRRRVVPARNCFRKNTRQRRLVGDGPGDFHGTTKRRGVRYAFVTAVGGFSISFFVQVPPTPPPLLPPRVRRTFSVFFHHRIPAE